MQRSLLIAAACWAMLPLRDAAAQGTVQQPVVEQVSAGFVVSVPDGGRLFLGGISSAGSTRRDFGPLPWGTANGGFATGSSLDVGVYIHDFESLDAALLAQPVARERTAPMRSPRASAAWRVLNKNWRREQ